MSLRGWLNALIETNKKTTLRYFFITILFSMAATFLVVPGCGATAYSTPISA
jgi:hypothetical protein